jgi:4-methoxybenzoate monooxygenase (O-demethylating)
MIVIADAGAPPALDRDPFSRDALLDPGPFQEALREAGPVVYLEAYDCYAVGRYAEVRAVLSTWRDFTVSGGVGYNDIRKGTGWRVPSALLEVDPPEHTQIRSAFQKIMTPATIKAWKDEFLSAATDLVASLETRQEVDGVRDIAETFVLNVFPRAAGLEIPVDAAVAIGDMNFNALGPKNDLFAASAIAAEPYLEWFERSFEREAALPGGFAQQVFEAADAGIFTQDIAKSLVRSFLRAGMDTTISGIGFALLLLAQNPDQYALVRSDRTLVKDILDEAIRVHSPANPMFRTTTRELAFGGFTLKSDTKIAAFIGAANRDPRQWADPAAFDIRRKTLGHLAFGISNHACIGQIIARLEAECILGAIIERFERIELLGDAPLRPVNTLKTQAALPLRLVSAAS